MKLTQQLFTRSLSYLAGRVQLRLLLVAVFVLSSSFVWAQSSTENQSQTKIPQSQNKSKNKKDSDPTTGNTNQSVAQGLSIAESMLLNQSPWGFFFSTLASRGLDEYADTWTTVNDLSVSYRLNSWSALGVSLGYEALVYKHDGEFFNNEDTDPGRYGLTDLEFSFTVPKLWYTEKARLVWSSALTLPTSRASQRNTLISELRTTLALRYLPNSRIIITPSLGVYGRYFEYDTANVFGTRANSPVGATAGIAGAYTFNSMLVGTLSYSQTLRYDYFRDWRTVQSATARLIVNATDVLNVSVGYNWRDQMITNEPLFDDDRSLMFIGVSYVF